MSALARWWDRLGRGQRAAVVVVGAVVVVNLAFSALDAAVGGGNPGGPTSSAFGTGADGLEAYADLLRADDRTVIRRREPLADGGLPSGATVVIADAEELRPSDVEALAKVVADGGRVVTAGEGSAEVTQALTGQPVRRVGGDDIGASAVWVPSPVVGTAEQLASEGSGWFSAPGGLVPVAGGGGGERPTVLTTPAAGGSIVAVADTSILQNRYLDRADNAAFALAVAGSSEAPVVFVESVHGYGADGLAALPSSWKWVLAGLAVTTAIGLWAAGTRFGPPDAPRRLLLPPRRDHVEALAADLDRVAGPVNLDGGAHGQPERTTVPADHPSGGPP